MIGPDATVTLDFALARLTGVVDKLVVYPGEHAEEPRPPRRAHPLAARAAGADPEGRLARGGLPPGAAQRHAGLARRGRISSPGSSRPIPTSAPPCPAAEIEASSISAINLVGPPPPPPLPERQLSDGAADRAANWSAPMRDEWVRRIVKAVERAARPVVLVAHSLGVVAVAHAAPRLPGRQGEGRLPGRPAGRRPPDFDAGDRPRLRPDPRDPLPLPVGSRGEPDGPVAPTRRRRTSPMPGARPSSMRAIPATSTRPAATGPGRRA